ncbi:MAG: polyprenyl synthetase family protein, partial [Desulfovibrionaceae bacterium]|nr:polyprenyl synthetase family protein [Desulfovibrionaceae bacterium]
YDYGYSVGMAFQLTDDLLDLTGDSKTIGKPAGNDCAKPQKTQAKAKK